MKARNAKPIKNPRGGLAAEVIKANAKAPKAAAVKTAKRGKAKAEVKAEPKGKADAKPSRTAFIDALFVEGGYTKAEIKAKVKAAGYPGTDEELTARINERPYWIKKAGKTPKWKQAEVVASK